MAFQNLKTFQFQMNEHYSTRPKPQGDFNEFVQNNYNEILEFEKLIHQMAEHQSQGNFDEFAQNNDIDLGIFATTVNNHFEYGSYRENQDSPVQRIIASLIQNHPSLTPAIDYFMIADQEVHLIESYFDENSQPADKVRDEILLNDFQTHPNTSAITQINTFYPHRPKGLLNKAVKEGVFFLEGEGKIPGEAIVRQYIPGLNNVVAHAEDGEFILLFDPHRKKTPAH